MKFNDCVNVAVEASSRGSASNYSRHRRAGPMTLGLICFPAFAALAGCSMSDGVGSFIIDPGRYSAYHCKDLVARLKVLLDQEKDLRNLMDRASEGGGGTVIGALSYRADYEKAVGEEKVLRRTAAEKSCELPAATSAAPAPTAPTSYESDKAIR
jgi:hypothetical protein